MQKFYPSLDISVFEDDLVTAICSYDNKRKKRRLCKIQRVNKGMGIVIWNKDEWHAYNYMDFTSIIVIGNIHENPEILTKW